MPESQFIAKEIIVKISLSSLGIRYTSWEDMDRVLLMCRVIEGKLKRKYPSSLIKVETFNDSGLAERQSTISVISAMNNEDLEDLLTTLKTIEEKLN